MKKKILVITNSDWFFLMHMLPITIALKRNGYEILVLAPNTGKRDEIIFQGFDFFDLPLDRKGINPLREFKTVMKIHSILKKVRPDIIHNITIKPIIYGSFLAGVYAIPVINTICGLGYSFINKTWHRNLAFKGYRYALGYEKGYHFFENKDDQNFFFTERILLDKINSLVINGVGVDLEKYIFTSKNKGKGKIIITMASRMIWEKGVREFIESAKLLYDDFTEQVEFRLYGRIDHGNPSSVPEAYLKSIEIYEYLKWFGFESDMFSVFQDTDIVVLPSYYREGCPMVLMEACAMGKPIVTTDSVGCRECVDEGVNGFKVPVKSISALAEAIEKLIISRELREQFGKASRKLAEKKFDQKQIINQYMGVFDQMLKS